jgi:prevent-host-death family protein
MPRLSATEAARRFSELLNRVAAGEEIEITRAGAPVATITRPKTRLIGAEHFREILSTAPEIDDDFAEDLRSIRSDVGPPESPWPS